MLIWFTEGWEYFAKWGKKEEAEMGQIIFKNWPEIKKAIKYIKQHKQKTREIKLGNGPGEREYTVSIFYTGRSRTQQDFLMMVGIAPITTIGMDLFAIMTDLPMEKKISRGLVGHIYDDRNDEVIQILGKSELRPILDKILNSIDEID